MLIGIGVSCRFGILLLVIYMYMYMSLVMRKPVFCICENKDADQLRGNREADQRLCFRKRIVQSICFLNPKIQASSHLLWPYSPLCVEPDRKPRRPVFAHRGSYVSFSGLITSVGEDRANLSVIMWFLFGDVSPSSWYLRKAAY